MILIGQFVLFFYFGAVAYAAPRIVGGHDAPDHKYPYLVSLRDDEHICGGSILNENWILTAAHCVFDLDANSYSISAGTNYLDEDGDVYLVEYHIIHEDFENFFYNDIALIRVARDIIFTDNVKPIRIPDFDLQDGNIPAVFAGWGSIEKGESSENSLQEIILQTMLNEECKTRRSHLTERHICTYNRISEGICHGDSGGPLVVNGSQIGIASYVVPCAVGYPDVFTRVYSFREWIKTNINRDAIE